ncbi:OmpA family protein [Larkinella terrae]|uniref:OmpA family protein n=1 Tax=Larkinella terrae TaxID=2025311 RepID=A0A7K0ER14_9BACT|nr:PA14 domain-containing protein [Larkinella terrae]MRS64244.1 OmpA family protein [Larkinella terrae]
MDARGLIWCVLGLAVWQNAAGQSKVGVANGLKGEYFVGTNYERNVFTRIDPEVNFDWEYGTTPGPGIGHSYYSIRWTGKLYAPKTGSYKFMATVDDGIRLWVNGKKVIEVWELNDNKTFRGEIRLVAGRYYDLRVDFFNAQHGGSISLYWIPPNQTGLTNLTRDFLFRTAPPKTVASTGGKKPLPVLPKKPKATAVATVPKTPDCFERLKTGDKLVLNQVFFVQSEYRLLPESYTELDKLVQALSRNPALRIEISGHTDNVGDPRLNLALSENRASVISTYLIRNGIDSQRIEAKGYGGTRPIADNATETGRSKNRRVEFVVR